MSTAPEIFASSNELQVLSSKPLTITLSFLPSSRRPPPKKLPALSMVGVARDEVIAPYQAVFLNFENIIGTGLPPVYEVYLNLPPDTEPTDDHRAGALAFYGLRASSTPSEEHGGEGMHVVLDISEIFNRLRTRPDWDETHLQIRLQPRKALASNAAVSIRRVSLYRQ